VQSLTRLCRAAKMARSPGPTAHIDSAAENS
jgi:hypothetical protein